MVLVALPSDILECILSHLDVLSLVRFSLASRQCHKYASNEHLWQRLAVDDFNVPSDASFRLSGWRDLYSRLNDSMVYTWGENFDGRLGHHREHGLRRQYNNYEVWTRPCELTELRGKGIVDIVAGGWSFHALDRHGRVWLWGTMQKPQHDDTPDVSRSLGVHPVDSPTRVALPSSVHVKSVACGRSHAIALGRSGQVWHWNNYQCPQQVLFDKPCRIVQVTANWGYSSALTAEGEVLVIPEPPLVLALDAPQEPMRISTLPISLGLLWRDVQASAAASLSTSSQDDSFVQIAGMEKCTLALTRFGRVFKLNTDDLDTFGASPADGAVELKNYSAESDERNERHRQMKRFISAQFRNFAVYTADGNVKLGHQDDTPETEPKIESNLASVCKVTFGDYHCGALSNQGQLLTWGAYSEGALGHGPMFPGSTQETPKAVEYFRDQVVFAAGFGGWHSGAVAIPAKPADQP